MSDDERELASDEDESIREQIGEDLTRLREDTDLSRRELMKAGGVLGATALFGGGSIAASSGVASAASGEEAVRAYLGSDTTISNNATTQITLDAESYDTNNNFDTTTGTYTAPSAGKYLVHWVVTATGLDDGSRIVCDIDVNNDGSYETQSYESSGVDANNTGSAVDVLDLSTSDTIAFKVWNDNGSNLTLRGREENTFVTIYKLGSGSGGSGDPVDVADDGTSVVTDANEINFGTDLSVTDNGSGNVTVDSTASGGSGTTARSAEFPRSELQDGEALSIPVPIADGESITVTRWGAITSADTTPAGLTIQLTEPGGTVITEENTELTTGSSVASTTNSSGGVKTYRLRIANSTGSNFVDGNSPDSVLGSVSYEIS